MRTERNMSRLLSWIGTGNDSVRLSRRKSARLFCEHLEDRSVPSTYIDQYTTPLECDEGQSLTLNAVSDEGDPPPVNVEWDFNYDGESFDADPSASGNLSPSHQFQSSGLIVVGLQVTEATGEPYITAAAVSVANVAPTATVANSGPTPEGSAVTFTIDDVADPDPNDRFTIWADWTGSDGFERMTDEDYLLGPTQIQHVYDDSGTYQAVIRVMDSDGDYSDYSQSVVVTNVAPTAATFGPANTTATTIMPGVPIQFTGVDDASWTDTQAGFTYFLSTDGGATYSSSSSPTFTPTFTPAQTYSLAGYIQDKDGGASETYLLSVTVVPSWTVIANAANGYLQVTWSGGSVTLNPNQYYAMAGNVTTDVTLLTPNAVYSLVGTNTSFGTVTAANPEVLINVTTDLDVGDLSGLSASYFSDHSFVPAMLAPAGDGHIDNVVVTGQGSLNGSYNTYTQFALKARGDLGSLTEVDPQTGNGVDASSIAFQNLTGSMTIALARGLDATWWLGDDSSDLIQVRDGIGTLDAYGVKGSVTSDLTGLETNIATIATIGAGGVPPVLSLGNVDYISVDGNVNEIDVRRLWGDVLFSGDAELLEIEHAEADPEDQTKYPKIKIDGQVDEVAIAQGTVKSILVKNIERIVSLEGLTVTEDVRSIQNIQLLKVVNGALQARDIVAHRKIGVIQTTGAGSITARDIEAQEILNIEAQGAFNITARKISATALSDATPLTHVFAGKDLTVTEGIHGKRKAGDFKLYWLDVTASSGNLAAPIYWEGRIKDIEVGNDFIGANNQWKVTAYAIDKIQAGGHIGGFIQNGQIVIGGLIETILRRDKMPGFGDKIFFIGGNIGTIHAGADITEPSKAIGGSILASRIHAEYGFIDTIKASGLGNRGGKMGALITAHKINLVQGDEVAGDVKIDLRLYVTNPAFGTPNNWITYEGSIGKVKATTLTSKTISGRLMGTIEVTGGQMEIATNVLFHAGLDAKTGALLKFGAADYKGTISVGYDALRFLNTPKVHRPKFGDGDEVLTITAQNQERTITVNKAGSAEKINIKSLIMTWDSTTKMLTKVGVYILTLAETENLAAGWTVREGQNEIP